VDVRAERTFRSLAFVESCHILFVYALILTFVVRKLYTSR
jgi:hypothetical protein